MTSRYIMLLTVTTAAVAATLGAGCARSNMPTDIANTRLSPTTVPSHAAENIVDTGGTAIVSQDDGTLNRRVTAAERATAERARANPEPSPSSNQARLGTDGPAMDSRSTGATDGLSSRQDTIASTATATRPAPTTEANTSAAPTAGPAPVAGSVVTPNTTAATTSPSSSSMGTATATPSDMSTSTSANTTSGTASSSPSNTTPMSLPPTSAENTSDRTTRNDATLSDTLRAGRGSTSQFSRSESRDDYRRAARRDRN